AVSRDALLLRRAALAREAHSTNHGTGAAGHAAGVYESALHSVSGDRFGILRDVLADLLFIPVLCEGGSALRAVRTAGNGGRLDYYSAYGAGDGDGEGLEADSRHYVRIFH